MVGDDHGSENGQTEHEAADGGLHAVRGEVAARPDDAVGRSVVRRGRQESSDIQDTVVANPSSSPTGSMSGNS
jgi:hypothetical protein